MHYDGLFKSLKVVGGELVVADLHLGLDLLLVAVLLGLLHALLLGHVGARQAGLLLAAWHDLLDLAGLADVPGHGLAVLAVAVPLGLLVPRPLLQLAHLLGLEVAVLPLLGLGVLVGHLLAVSAVLGLAHLGPHLSGGLVAALPGDLLAGGEHAVALHTQLGGLLLLAVEVEGFLARDVHDGGHLVHAHGGLQVGALGVIPAGLADHIAGVAEALLHHGAQLHAELLHDRVELHLLLEAADELGDVEAAPVLLSLDDAGAVPEGDLPAILLGLGDADLLHVGLAHVLVLHLVHHGAPGRLPAVVAHNLAVVVSDVDLLAIEVGGGGWWSGGGWWRVHACHQGDQQEGEGEVRDHDSSGGEASVLNAGRTILFSLYSFVCVV